MPRTANPEGDQTIMFPELDDSPEHKALMKSVRKFVKVKQNRDEVLGTQKQECDKAMEDVIVKMKAANISKFHHQSLSVEIIPGKEKVKVKMDPEEGDDPDDESSDE